jgi:two-component system, sensor histidine kinase LadS
VLNSLPKQQFFILLLTTLTSCTLKDQRVRNEVAERMVVNDIAYDIDSTNSWKIEDVVASKNEFKPYTEPELNFGHLRDALWVRVSLENLTSDSQEIYLSSDQFILEDVQFFYQKDSSWQKASSGWGRPVLARQLPTYLHAFTFSLAPKEKTSVYYRVKNEYQMLRLPLTLYDKQGFYSHHNKSLLMDGLVIMALLTSILFSLYQCCPK